ncbi:MAG: hypothetical protein FWE85_02360 [Clostridiales bacterium]|nr:hypothetical protein [Clostridiales bacterium]
MQCYICGKELDKGYLCEEHRQELKRMIRKKENLIENPKFKHHCLICGEFKGRIIIDYPSVGPFCDEEIEDAVG